MYHNNHPQPQWQNNNNSYPPLSTTPARKPTSYDPSTPINVNLSPHPNNMVRARMMRTPSPTPSEQKELSSGAIDWKTLMNWRFWLRREWLCASQAFLGFLSQLTQFSRVLRCPRHHSRYYRARYPISRADCPLANPRHPRAPKVWFSFYSLRFLSHVF